MSETCGLTAKNEMARTKLQVKKINARCTRRTRNLFYDLPRGVRHMVLDRAAQIATDEYHAAFEAALIASNSMYLPKRAELLDVEKRMHKTRATRIKLQHE